MSPEQYVEQEVISAAELAEEVVEAPEVFHEEEEVLAEDVKVEDAVNGIVEEQHEDTFLCENIFENPAITKAFEDEDVFVNEVTIEEEVKEEPVEVSQE